MSNGHLKWLKLLLVTKPRDDLYGAEGEVHLMRDGGYERESAQTDRVEEKSDAEVAVGGRTNGGGTTGCLGRRDRRGYGHPVCR